MRMPSKFMERPHLPYERLCDRNARLFSAVARTKDAMSNRFSLEPIANNFPQYSLSLSLIRSLLQFYILNCQVSKIVAKFAVQEARRVMTAREASIKISCQRYALRYCKAEHDRVDDISSSATNATIIIYGSTQPRSPYSPPLSRVTNAGCARVNTRVVLSIVGV